MGCKIRFSKIILILGYNDLSIKYLNRNRIAFALALSCWMRLWNKGNACNEF